MRCACCGSQINDHVVYCPYCETPTHEGAECRDYQYDVFISYRHLPRDRKVAMRIQRSLEGMRIPREIQERYNTQKRLGKFFRDEDELPMASSLPDQILNALTHSRFLLVVCTPQTRESQWVTQEVELFASLHGRSYIYIALAEGSPEESFPTLLMTRLVPDDTGVVQRVEQEPVAADFRDDKRAKFDAERLRVAAALIGCDYDDLRQRQRTRKARLVSMAASGIAIMSLAFGAFSWYQQVQISKNYRHALLNESEALAEESAKLLADGSRMEAIQVALAALPASSSDTSRPLVPAAQLALERALNVYPTEDIWQSRYAISDTTYCYELSDDGLVATITTTRDIRISTVEDNQQVALLRASNELASFYEEQSYVRDLVFCGNDLLVVGSSGVFLYRLDDTSLLWQQQIDGLYDKESLTVSPDGTTLALSSYDHDYVDDDYVSVLRMRLLALATGNEQASFTQVLDDTEISYLDKPNLAYRDDGSRIAVSSLGTIYLVDPTQGVVHTTSLAHPNTVGLGFCENTLFAISTDSSISSFEFGNGAHVTVEALDEDLATRWSKDEVASSSFTSRGITEPALVKITGSLEDNELDGSHVAIMAGASIVIYNPHTGDVVFRIQTTSPFCDCAVLDKDNLIAIDTNGDLMINRSFTLDTVVGSARDLNIGETKSAHFVQVGDQVYVAALDNASNSLRVFCMVTRFGQTEISAVDGAQEANTWDWSEDSLVSLFDDSLACLDSTTYDTRWFKSLSELGIDSDVEDYSCTGDSVFVMAKRDSGHTLHRISLTDGSPVGTLNLDEHTYNYKTLYMFERENKSYLLTHAFDAVHVWDLQAGTRAWEYKVPEDYTDTTIDRVFVTDTHVVLSLTGIHGAAFAIYGLGEDELLECDLGSLTLSSSNSTSKSYAALSPDKERFAVVGDGTLRLYETKTWSELWRNTTLAADMHYIDFSPDSSHILIQNNAGRLMLVSVATGEIERASAATLPPIEDVRLNVKLDDTLCVFYRHQGLFNDMGLALISLDEESFGPMDDLFLGFFLSDDGKTVLAFNTSSHTTIAYRRFTLDELIARANQEIEGHDLTITERKLYRIG